MNLLRRYVFCNGAAGRLAAKVVEDRGGPEVLVIYPSGIEAKYSRAQIQWEALSYDAKIAFDRELAQMDHDCERGTVEYRRQYGIPRREQHAEV